MKPFCFNDFDKRRESDHSAPLEVILLTQYNPQGFVVGSIWNRCAIDAVSDTRLGAIYIYIYIYVFDIVRMMFTNRFASMLMNTFASIFMNMFIKMFACMCTNCCLMAPPPRWYSYTCSQTCS